MSFTPNLHDILTLDGVAYCVAEHPAAPGIPHGQEGRVGIVYRLVAPADDADQALKVFKPRFRLPYLVAQAERIAPYADLPGLVACRRVVLTPQRHAALLRQHPDLTYAVLMPWIEGPTWQEVLLAKQPLALEQSLALARGLAEALMRMEEQGIAHCDLSAPNVLLPALAQSAIRDPKSAIELVDLEGLYAPGMLRPQTLSSGSAGYAHRQAADGLWGPEADRFAGAVLLAEMLGWGDPQVVHAAWGESYFDPREMQQDCPRYRSLLEALRSTWGEAVATLIDRAWRSETLADCPTFGEWLVALPERPPVEAEHRSAPTGAPSPVGEELGVRATDLTRAQVQALMEAARRLEEKGNLEGALTTYRQAQALAAAEPALAALAQEIGLTMHILEKRWMPRVQSPPGPPPAPGPMSVADPGVKQRSRRWGVVGVVLLLAVIVGAIGWVWWQRQQEMAAQAKVAAALAQYEVTRAVEALAATTTAIAAEQATETAQTQAIATARAAEQATVTAQAQATATAHAAELATSTAQVETTAAARAAELATTTVQAQATATAQAETTATARAAELATAIAQAQATAAARAVEQAVATVQAQATAAAQVAERATATARASKVSTAPQQPAIPTSAPVTEAPILLSPVDGFTLWPYDTATFRWKWTGRPLGPNEGFELRIWKEGNTDHPGAAPPVPYVADPNHVYSIYIGSIRATPGVKQIPTDYWINVYWTVAVVQINPYKRIGPEARPFWIHT